jgi:hypothetical protein
VQSVLITFDETESFDNLISSVGHIFEDDASCEVYALGPAKTAEIRALLETPPQSNLVDHATRELMLIGEEPETILGYLRVIRAFADMGHSGGSASVAIPVIGQLLKFRELSPLTDDPDEWVRHTEEMWPPDGVWQNRRNGEAFSNDGGKTYYLLSEGANSSHREPLHTSVHKE